MNFEDELPDAASQTPPEREISLGTGTILGIFFVLALLFGGFFGFGYSMGRRSAQSTAGIPPTGTVAKKDATDSPFSNFKAAPVAGPRTTGTPPKSRPEDPPPSSDVSNDAPNDAPVDAPGAVAQPTATSDGSWMVQVSATTRKPDAEALTKVLLGKGFTATIKEDADQKFHVRVGPFASKKDADTTRKLLVASGYKDPFLTPR